MCLVSLNNALTTIKRLSLFPHYIHSTYKGHNFYLIIILSFLSWKNPIPVPRSPIASYSSSQVLAIMTAICSCKHNITYTVGLNFRGSIAKGDFWDQSGDDRNWLCCVCTWYLQTHIFPIVSKTLCEFFSFFLFFQNWLQGQQDSTAGQVLALPAANLGSILGIRLNPSSRYLSV